MSVKERQRAWQYHRAGYDPFGVDRPGSCPRCGTHHGSPDGCPADRRLYRRYLAEVYVPRGFLLRGGRCTKPGWYPLRGYGRDFDAEMRAREAGKYGGYPATRVTDQTTGEPTMVHDEREAV